MASFRVLVRVNGVPLYSFDRRWWFAKQREGMLRPVRCKRRALKDF